MVKTWRTPGAAWRLGFLTLAAGCAVHDQGLVRPHAGGVRLETPSGRHDRLRLHEDARWLAGLDGHTVRVDGVRMFGAVWLSRWVVPEGLHGMTAWIGPLRWHGLQLGIDDHNSGAFYLVDRDAVSALTPFAGRPVLLEGYVEGAHIVRVLYYRVLDEGADAS